MNDYFKRVAVVACSSFFLLFFLSALPVHAQTTEGLQIKPAVVEDQVNPGDTRQYTLTVTNIANVEKTFYVSVEDIKGVDDEGGPIFAKAGEVTGYELSSWVNLLQKTTALGPGEGKTISFSIHVPTSASPGSHFASVFFSDKPEKRDVNGASVGVSIGAIISLRISGDITEEARLREFSTGKLIYGVPDVDFKTKVQNLGNVLVQPTGFVEVTNMFGKKVASVPVNSSLASVFPNSERAYNAQWSSAGLAFGRYQAIVSLVYGEGARKTIYSTTSFWILPLVPISIALGVLLTLVLGAYWMMKAYIRKKLRQMGVPNASRADTDLYRKKYQKSSSRLLIVTMVIILLCIMFLVVLFLMFA